MALIITKHDAADQTGMRAYWTYNGLDCCVTREVWDVLHPRLTPVTRRTYYFQMACQSPAMAMMFRGVAVDNERRLQGITILESDSVTALDDCRKLAGTNWSGVALVVGKCPSHPEGKYHKWPRGLDDADPAKICGLCGAARIGPQPFNPLSDDQTKKLLYADIGLPEMYNKKGKVSVDKEVLERIGNKWPDWKPLVDGIDRCRKIRKQISVLKSGVSSDGRMRSTFVVGGAETGRWSSTGNPHDEGTNLQNIAEKLRNIFIADPGRRMFYADLEQAESCCVAHLAGDEEYILAHKTGDVHTFVSRILWPELPWNGDIKKDKIIAEDLKPKWDPDHSFRYNAKRIQHGSNYLLTPYGMARIARIRKAVAQEAQDRYFTYFPKIREWHHGIYNETKATGVMITPLGRRRQFFGRIWDDHTVKQAVAHGPQSMVADILNTAIWRAWKELDPEEIWLLAQVHDAILGSVEGVEGAGTEKAIGRLLDLMAIPVHIGGRTMVIPTDVKCGANWGKFNEKPEKGPINLGGMR